LDNIGFFPPNELRKVLKEIGINSNDIEKIQRCLPLDEDGHYSIDNLIKLFLGTK
jgi:NACalpha-BTF3-like transcription factor